MEDYKSPIKAVTHKDGNNINILNQDMYMYEVYNDFLNKMQFYQLNGNIKSLSIRYYKKNYALSKGIHAELDLVSSKKYDKTYDIFDFTPVLESQTFQYQNMNDENNQGVIRTTTGQLTIMCVEEPLPNDIFHFYGNESEIEYLTVTNVTYIMSVKKLHIYQLEYETANVKKSSLDKFDIHQHFYFLREFSKFVGSSLYNDFSFLLSSREDLIITINKYYNSRKCYYSDNSLDIISPEINIKINKMLSIISENVYIPEIKPILVVDPGLPTDIKLSFLDSTLALNNELVNSVKKIYDIYYKIFNYSVIINDAPTAGTPVVETTAKQYKTTTIKDLEGNILASKTI